MKKSLSRYWIAVGVFVLAFIVLGAGYFLYFRGSVHSMQTRYMALADRQVSNIDNALSKILGKTDAVGELILDHHGELDFFDSRVPSIFEAVRANTGVQLLNIAVAPGGVVSRVYPLSGNEALLNFNFLNASLPGNAAAIAALSEKRMVLTNPFNLKQGGVGMGARTPIYMKNGEDDFWGLYTVTFRFSSLLKLIGLETLTDEGIHWQLYYTNNEGKHVTLAQSETLPSDPVAVSFPLQNLKWTLAVSPSDGWFSMREAVLAALFVLLMSCMVGMLAFSYMQLRDHRNSLRRLAERDGLTRCYSRHYLNTVLINPATGTWIDPTARYSLAMIDIDNFKTFNDRFGHETGDRAIMAVANILQSAVRLQTPDCIIRFGGDEFLMLISDVTKVQMRKILESVQAQTRALHFPDVPELSMTLSIGCECFASEARSSYYEMLRSADEKLYSVKKGGRNAFLI